MSNHSRGAIIVFTYLALLPYDVSEPFFGKLGEANRAYAIPKYWNSETNHAEVVRENK